MVKQFHLTNRWNTDRYHHSGQSGPGSNGNEGILLVLHNSKSVALLSNEVKVSDRSRGRPEGSLFNSYYTEV